MIMDYKKIWALENNLKKSEMENHKFITRKNDFIDEENNELSGNDKDNRLMFKNLLNHK